MWGRYQALAAATLALALCAAVPTAASGSGSAGSGVCDKPGARSLAEAGDLRVRRYAAAAHASFQCAWRWHRACTTYPLLAHATPHVPSACHRGRWTRCFRARANSARATVAQATTKRLPAPCGGTLARYSCALVMRVRPRIASTRRCSHSRPGRIGRCGRMLLTAPRAQLVPMCSQVCACANDAGCRP